MFVWHSLTFSHLVWELSLFPFCLLALEDTLAQKPMVSTYFYIWAKAVLKVYQWDLYDTGGCVIICVFPHFLGWFMCLPASSKSRVPIETDVSIFLLGGNMWQTSSTAFFKVTVWKIILVLAFISF